MMTRHTRIRCGLRLAMGWLLAGAASAAPPLGAEHLEMDVEQTMLCRRALAEDPVLAPLNLGVRVRAGVATLWGPAPSSAVSRRAEECLRTLIELVDVSNRLHVDPYFDWTPPTEEAPDMPSVLPEKMLPILPDWIRPPGPRPPLGELGGLARR